MTQRKQKLLELAKRCEAGELEISWPETKAYVIDGLGKDIKTYEAQQLSIHLNDALKGSLDAVAALEKELLPDGFYLTIDNSGYCCECDITTDEQVDNDGNGYPVYKIITAFAPTEPLARLAALLKALAEMEGE